MDIEQTAEAIACKLKGMPQNEIAHRFGVHESTISRTVRSERAQAIIERETHELINRALKPARLTLSRLAAEGIKSTDKDMLRLSLDASRTIFNAVGLGGNQSIVVNNILAVNSHDTPPAVAQLLSHLNGQAIPAPIQGDDVIDI